MSHITKVKTQLKDCAVLKAVLNKEGYTVDETAGKYNQNNNPFSDAEFTASKKGEILAFKKSNKDNAYSISADWYEIKRGQQAVINQITQAYSQEKIIRMAKSRGYSIITNRIDNRGQIEMVLRKVA
jgi:hypothetical protein